MKRPNCIIISIALIGISFSTISCASNQKNKDTEIEKTTDTNLKPNSGTDDLVLTSVIQPDGKIIIGGWFKSYNGTARNGIARLNSDGSLDTSFNPGMATGTISLQPDGKIIIAGGPHGISRLNADGSLDNSFNTGKYTYGTIDAISLQADGKIIIGGRFSKYGGSPRNGVARLNTDGSLDTNFKSDANEYVFATSLQPDGKIIIGGEFKKYNGVERKGIARLNTDGSLDTSFDPGKDAKSSVFATVVQPDGKILVGGYFSSYKGADRNSIVRLNVDGSLDTSFIPDTGYNFSLFNHWPGGNVRTISLQKDGKIVIGGNFRCLDESATKYVARLNVNGSIDRSFNYILEKETNVWTTLVRPDGKIIIGHNLSESNGGIKNGLSCLNSDGSLDKNFNQ